MCTILLAYRVNRRWPVIIGNNRDEFYDRPAVPPRVFAAEAGGERWLAPIDLAAGGSWWACNRHGLLVCLTNRWHGELREVGLVSRGQLVRELVRCADPAAARRQLAATSLAAFSPFNLLVAGKAEAFLFSNYPEPLELPLAPGFHFLGNGPLRRDDSLKARMAAREFAALENRRVKEKREILAAFARLLRLSLPQEWIPPQGFNVSLDGYGTTSSTLLALGDGPAAAALNLAYATGNPLRVPFRDYSPLGRLLF
ncbi:MAG: NRDE family protein [Deltaproteobacteria bacterium]|nr:NRDE family protein [Deltaproteobacteria bacterium]